MKKQNFLKISLILVGHVYASPNDCLYQFKDYDSYFSINNKYQVHIQAKSNCAVHLNKEKLSNVSLDLYKGKKKLQAFKFQTAFKNRFDSSIQFRNLTEQSGICIEEKIKNLKLNRDDHHLKTTQGHYWDMSEELKLKINC